MATTSTVSFQSALSYFATTNTNNKTGVNSPPSSLVNVGTFAKSYQLSLQGNITAGSVGGLGHSALSVSGK